MRRIYLIFTILVLATVTVTAQNILFQQDFEGTVTGWTADGTPGNSDWQVGSNLSSPGFSIPAPADNGNYAVSNDLACFCDLNSDIYISPLYDFTGLSNIYLKFDSYLPNPWGTSGATDSKGYIMVKPQGGTWIQVYDVTPNTAWNEVEVLLDTYVSGPAQIGFMHSDQNAQTTGWAIDNIMVYTPWSYDIGVESWTAPTTGCLNSDEDVVVVIKNFGVETISSFDIYYTLDGTSVPAVTVNLFGVDVLDAEETYIYTFDANLDLTVGAAHEFNVTVNLNGTNVDQATTNNSLTNNIIVKRFADVALSQTDEFIGDESYYWTIDANAEATAEFMNETVAMAGKNISSIGWVGNGAATTADNAWNYNTDWQSMMELTCNGGEVPVSTENLELVVRMRQEFSYNAEYCWFSVFVNGSTQVANQFSELNLNPTSQTGDQYFEQIFNLSAFNTGTPFTIELRSCTQYPGDKVIIDNITLRPRNEKDAGVSQILSPASDCGLGDINDIAVAVTNYGVEPISDVEVWYTIDGGATEYFAGLISGTIPVNGVSAVSVFPAKPTPGLEVEGVHTFTAFTKLAGDIYFPGNDAMTISVSNMPVISDFPYTQDFEGTTYWTTGGANSSWEMGVPDAGNTVINAAASGNNVWMTNLDGDYNNSENSFVLGPCFDFSTLADPSISFKLWYNTDDLVDGLQLQSSVDDGSTWQVIGEVPTGPNTDNWYVYNDVSAFGTGQPAWTGNSNTYLTATYSLANLAQVSNVKLRFVFMSDGDNLGGNPPTVQNYDGIAIDDIEISDPQAALDIRAMEWLTPMSAYYMTSTETVSFMLKNLGTETNLNFQARFSINGGISFTAWESFTATIATYGYDNFTFVNTADFANAGVYDCIVEVKMTGDENSLNDATSAEITSFPSINTFPYFEDFQNDDHFWTAGGTSSSWELGIPSQGNTFILPESNLDSAWVTDLDGTYNTNEFSWVESPLMDFTNLIMPAISMKINYNIESFLNDGANLQYSIAGGNWVTVGTINDATLGYVYPTINGLGGLVGWTDNSNGWKTVSIDLPANELAGQSDIKLRILFGSDTDVEFEGMAFDDVSVYENAPHDLAATEWLSQAIACGLSDQEVLSVRIANNGYFSESNYSVAYRVEHMGVTVGDTVVVTDPVSVGSTYDFTFASSVDMSVPGVYNCEIEIITADSEMANNLITRTIQSSPMVASFPYNEGFEAGDGNWVVGGTNSSWELGTPNASNQAINAAAEGLNAWATNLNGDYNHLEDAYVESPCFDFSGINYPAINFSYISDCEVVQQFVFDGAIFEFSTDGGASWTKLGATGDTLNWYNYSQIYSFGNTDGWSGNSNGWVNTGFDMFWLAGQSNVKFRFRFASDDSTYPAGTPYDGFGFDDFTVYNNAPFPVLTFVVTDNICYNGTDGAIDASVTGGYTPYTYTWADGFSTEDRTGLEAGTYNLTLVDAQLNTIDTFVTVTEGAAYFATINETQTIACNGQASGALEVVTPGNNAPYTYNWDNGDTDAMITGLTAGTYCVEVTDADGCIAQGSFTGQSYTWSITPSITNHTLLIANATVSVDGTPVNLNEYAIGVFYDNGGVLECGGYVNWDGSATSFEAFGQDYLVSTGFADAEAFTWKVLRLADNTTLDAVASYDANTPYVGGNFAAGNISNILTIDASSPAAPTGNTPVCAILVEPDPMTLFVNGSIYNGYGISCNGGDDGQIVAGAFGGESPYTFVWDNGFTGQNNSGLVAGTYIVTVSDNAGCQQTWSTTLEEPTALAITVTVTDVTCNGYADGQIDLTVSGGVSPYSYTWNNGFITEDLANVTAGTYTVSVLDANGCGIDASATVIESVLLPLVENFETGILPTGWQNTYAIPAMGWEFGSDLSTPGIFSSFDIPAHTVYAASNDDRYDDYTGLVNDASMDYLITPPMDFTGYSTVDLTFDAFFPYSSFGSVATVEVSVNGGPWVVVETLGESPAWQEDYAVSLQSYVGMCNVRVAFHHDDSGMWASGFAIDNVNIVGTTHDLELTAWNYPVGDNCGLTNSEQVEVTVTNLGAIDATGFDIYYTLNGVLFTETYTGTLAAGATIDYSFAAMDLSTYGTFTATAGVNYTLDGNNANDEITGVTFGNHPTITSFPYVEDFEDVEMEYFNLSVGAEASADIVTDGANYTLEVTGGNPLVGWNGNTANDAWNNNSAHKVSAVTWCMVDATALNSLELLIDLQQMFSNVNTNSWFRVLIDGVQVGIDYIPNTMTDSMETVVWDLDSYLGNPFTLTFEFANANVTDKVILDNITLREKLVDLAISDITVASACTYTSAEDVVVEIENLVGNPASGFDVILTVDGGTPVTETYNGAAIVAGGTGTHTFTGLADLSTLGNHTIAVAVSIANDIDNTNDNDMITVVSKPFYNTYPFAETATNFENYWTAGGVNSSWMFSAGYWATDANNGNYNNLENSYVMSPCFDFTTLNAPVIEFDLAYTTEPNVDNVVLEFTIDGGATWNVLGTQGDNDNWYTAASGWSNDESLLTVRHEMFSLAGQSAVQFRLSISTDDDTNMNGVSFNNVAIYEQNDVGAVATAPSTVCTGVDFYVDVTVQNFGYATITAGSVINVEYTLNGNTVFDAIALTADLAPQATAMLSFTAVENMLAGNYSIDATATMVADFNTTNDAMTTGSVEIYALPVVDFGDDISICEGNNQALDPGAFATYIWSDTSTDQTLVVSQAGTYAVTVTDSNGCMNSDDINIGYYPLSVVDLGNDTSICDGESATLDAGIFDSYSWTGGSTNQTLVVSVAGTYSVTVTDVNNCTATDDIVVSIDALPNAFAGTDTTICENESVTLTATGGNSYIWSTNETTPSIFVSPAITTTYTVTVTDGQNGCSATDDVMVTVNYGPIIDNAVVTNVTCNGYNDGTITLSVSGGVSPYNYTWTNAVGTTHSVSGLAPGTYDVTITDQGGVGCDYTASYTVIEPDPVMVNIIDVANNTGYGVACYGDSTGHLMAIASNIVGNPTYNWSNGEMTQEIDSLWAATYAVTVTDANTCMGTADFTVTQPAELTSSVATTDVTCFGAADGTAIATPMGGTPPYYYDWTTANNTTTQSLSGLGAGNYPVWISDVNGCVIVDFGVVNEPSELILTGSVTTDYNGYGVSCFGENDGAVMVDIIGGVTPYVMEWNTGETVDSIGPLNVDPFDNDGLPYQTTYSVTVTDANGCVKVEDIILTQPAPLFGGLNSPLHNGYNIGCNGGNDGEISVSVNDGVPPYTYLWSNNETTTTITGLTAGAYSVTATDANGCSLIFNKTLTEPDVIVANAVVYSNYNGEDVSCYGGVDGQAEVIVTGGVDINTILWSNNSNTTIATGLSAGTYTVTVTDKNGCVATSEVSLTEPIAITGSAWVTSSHGTYGTHVSCYGASDGSGEATGSGGTGAISYSWSNGQTGATLTNAAAGTYYVTIADANGCEYLDSIEIVSPDEIILVAEVTSDYNGSDISCLGSTDGTANVTATGGTGTLSYLWSNGDATAAVTGLGAETYTVTVTDENGCSEVASVTLTAPTQVEGTLVISSDYNGADITCYGAADGALLATATGGISPYSYGWSTGVTTDMANTGLVAGFYALTIYDANNCPSGPLFKQLTQPDELVVVADTSDYFGYGVTCNGGNDGWADATPQGGTAPYIYTWSNGATDVIADTLVAGTYDVTVTDVNGCIAYSAYEITEPVPVIATSVVSEYNGYNISCYGGNDGTVDLTPADGIAPYQFAWSNGGTDEDLIDLTAGTYDVTVTDDHGCVVYHSVTLTEPVLFEIDTIVITTDYDGYHVSCFGATDGAADLTLATGIDPFTYEWSNGEMVEDPVNLPAGTNTVTITDANGCTVEGSIDLTEPSELQATASITSDHNGYEISCPGAANGAATVDVSVGFAPYSFVWSNGANTQSINGLVAGTYEVTITDAHGCIGVASVTLNDPPQLDYTATVTDVDCYGNASGAIDVEITGGVSGTYLYFWNTGANTQDIDNLTAGVYYLLVLDANWCHVVTEVFVIGQPDVLSANALVTTDFDGFNTSCNGAADAMIDLTVAGGTAPYDIVWSNSEITEDLSNVAAGTYDVTVTDDNGCETYESVMVTEPALFEADAVIDTDFGGYAVSCNGATDGEISVALTNGFAPFTYAWDNGSTDAALIGVGVGDYYVTVTDAHGCEAMSMVTLTGADAIVLSTAVMSSYNGYDVACNGGANGAIDITVNGGVTPFTYLWSNGETTANIVNAAAGENIIVVTDANGCSATDTVTLSEPVALNATIANTILYHGSQISCNGEADAAIEVIPAGGVAPYVYAWSTGEITPTLMGLGAGTYTVTVTDDNNCEFIVSYDVIEPDAITLTVTSFDPPCYGMAYGSATAIAAGGTAPYMYYWSNSETTQSIMGLTPGNYYVFALDSNLCQSNTYPVTISQPDELIGTATVLTHNTCAGDTDGEIDLEVVGGTAPYTYSWSNGETTQDINNLPGGTYTVTITDSHNCNDVVSVVVDEPAAIALTLVETHVDCYAQSTGSIQVTVDNGVAPLAYNWSNGASTEDLVGIVGGFYFLTVTDADGCSAIGGKFITEPDELILDIVTSQPLCNGDAYGAIDLTVSGGTAPYSYTWTNGETTADITGLTAGLYEVTVIDANGCSERVDDLLVDPDVLTTSITGVDNNCNAGGGGTIDLTVMGGTTPYSYYWSNTETTEDLSGLAAGTYTVDITDANGCTTSTDYVLGDAVPVALNLVATNVSCNGMADGAVDLTITDGVSPYVAVWSGPGFGQTAAFDWTFTNTGSNHTILISNSLTSNIGGAPLAIGDYIGVFYNNGLDCGGYVQWNGVSVALTAWGAEAGMTNGFAAGETFTWKVYRAADGMVFNANVNYMSMPNGDQYTTNGMSGIDAIEAGMDEDLTGLTAGTYDVTVYDAVGCTGIGSISITQPSVLMSTVVKTDVSCNGAADGAINLTVIGGTAPYSYAWTTGSTDQDVDNLAPGTYTVTITDANGCTIENTATITQPDMLTFSWTTTDVLCNGDATGTAMLTIDGGVAPYNVNWGGYDENALAAGTYNVIVTDDNGCSTNNDITINEPAAIQLTETVVNVSCYGYQNGEVDLTVVGGVAPYVYAWSNGETTGDLANLDEGSYDVTVTDANLCEMMTSVTVSQPAMLEVSGVVTDLVCYNDPMGAINVTVVGGTSPYSFAWSNGETTEDLSTLYAGNFTVTVTDANNCVVDMTFDVVEPAELAVSGIAVDVTCFGGNDGAIDLTVAGGVTPYVIAWDNASADEDQTNLTAGDYYVTVTDANGCETSDMFTVAEPLEIMLSTTISNVSCYGLADGNIDLTVANGIAPFVYTWSNGELTEDIAALVAGTYEVTVEDANGCMAYATITVVEPAELAISAVVDNVSCNGAADGSIDATITGGTTAYSYGWSGLESVAFDWDYTNTGTNHTVVVDVNTAFDLNGMGIAVGDVIGVFYDSLGTLECAGYVTWDGSNTNVAAWGAELSLGSGQTLLNGMNIGEEFKWKVWQAATGIVYDAVATYNQGFLDSMYYVTDGVSSIATLTGSIAYEPFTANGNVLDNLAPGAYNLLVTDANGCEVEGEYMVSQPDAIMITANVSDYSGFGVSACGAADGYIDITVTGGVAPLSFTWNNGETIEDLTALAAGTYSVVVADANGCTGDAMFTLEEFCNSIVLSATATDVTCNGTTTGAVDLSITGGLAPISIAWSNGEATEDISGLAVGVYTVTVSDAYGQVEILSTEIFEPAVISHTAVINNAECYGTATGSIDVTIAGGVAPYTFVWTNGTTNEDVTLLTAGLYGCMVTDANGCTYQMNFGIAQPSEITIAEVITDCSVNGANDGAIDITVAGGTAPYSFNWDNGSVSEDVDNLVAGMYAITVTDDNGCEFMTTFTVDEPAPVVTPLNIASIVPTAATCTGLANGSIDLTVEYGTTPYTFAWSNGEITEDITGLLAGMYSVTVTDANNVDATATVEVLENASTLAATATVTNAVSCVDNGAVDITITGGTAPYSFLWNNGETTEDLIDVAQGTYELTITDANGCQYYTTEYVDANLMAVNPMVSGNTCYGDANASVIVFVTGGVAPYTYSWSTGDTFEFVFGLTAGSYTVTVTDALGCDLIETIDVVDPDPIVVDIVQNPIGLTATPISGYVGNVTFMWSNNKPYQSIKGLTSGVTYCVTITDDNGCQGTACYTWNSAPSIAFNSNFSKDDEATIEIGQTISLYPNPTSDGKFFVDLSNITYENIVLDVLDANGRVVYNTRVIDNSDSQVAVVLENAEVGVYHVRIVTNNNTVLTKRIVITK